MGLLKGLLAAFLGMIMLAFMTYPLPDWLVQRGIAIFIGGTFLVAIPAAILFVIAQWLGSAVGSPGRRY